MQGTERRVGGSLGENRLGKEWTEAGKYSCFSLCRGMMSHIESRQTKFSSSKQQNCLGRLSTMGIPRPSPNILIQKVGVGRGPGNRIVNKLQGKPCSWFRH